MKFKPFEGLIREKTDKNMDSKKSGNPELALNKEIYGILSDPEFIRTFPSPSDFQYDLIRESLTSSRENAKNGIAYLKEYIKTSNSPLFCLIRLSQFLQTAIGNQKIFLHDKEQKEISNILEKGFDEISSDKNTKYFLSIVLKPDIVLSSTQSFENQERGLTPIQISKKYFLQDNGFDPIPIFYHTEKPGEFISLINEQKKFFENARPYNRPEMSRNPTLEEMSEYKKRYLDPIINFDNTRNHIREKINKSTNRLSIEELQKFFPESKNIYEFSQDPLMFEFRVFANQEVRSILEKEFNVDFKEIPLKEQIYFLTSISNRTNENIKPVKEFTKNYKAIGLRTFLSIEQGGKEMGDKILSIGEKLPEEVAREIFAKYSEYIDVVDNIENIIKNIYPNKEIDHTSLEKIKLTLLNKGKDILISQYDKLTDNTFDLTKFNDFMENAKADVDLFKNTFKVVFEENKDTKFEEFLNLKVSTNKSKDLNEEKIEEIKEIINRNYKNEELKNMVLKSFENSLNNENTEVSILERDNKVVASARLDFNSDDSIYFGSFNVDPNYCSAKIGNAFFKSIVSPYIKTHEVKADCSVRQPVSAYYIEAGFIGTQIYDYAGEPSLSIQTFHGKEFISKNLTKKEIIQMSTNEDNKFLIKKFNKQDDIAFYFPKDKLLTRFFYDSDSKNWFALWE